MSTRVVSTTLCAATPGFSESAPTVTYAAKPPKLSYNVSMRGTSHRLGFLQKYAGSRTCYQFSRNPGLVSFEAVL